MFCGPHAQPLAAGLAVLSPAKFELLQVGLRELDATPELDLLVLLAGQHWMAPLELVVSLAGAPSTYSCPRLVEGHRWKELLELVA